ncbi:MAG TPA: hypothetical protein VF628_03620 [Allosphingosinicella sp.]|jgi:uncharacterized repeat protein (TIGR01451 family)
MNRVAAFLTMLAAIYAATPSIAACTADNQFTFDWNTIADGELAYNQTRTFIVSNAAGATRSFTVSFTTNGLNSTVVDGQQLPTIRVINTGGQAPTEKTLTIGGTMAGRTTDINGTTRVVAAIFTFSEPVRDLNFRVFDIDYILNSWRDWVKITGRDGGNTHLPAYTKSATSTVKVGASGSPLALGAGELLGTSNATATQDSGTVSATFVQPVSTLELRYGNYPLQVGETATGTQWISIHDLTFCPMPVLAVSKSSAPLATSGADRFNAPSSDVVYTITATNTGGSPVDLNGVVLTDLLPAQVTFYNADFDTALAGTDPFVLTAGSSGVTLGGANVAYSNNGGASYAYTPAAGYDPAVNGVRFTPGGSLAANSSFSIRFRARIK